MRKKMFTRAGSVLLMIILVISLFAACGSKNKGKEQEISPTTNSESTAKGDEKTQVEEDLIDTSKKVEVIMYLAGDGAVDSPMVEQELSKRMENDLNCTLKIINIPWADWAQKYPLIMTSGEKYDLIYASGWAEFSNFANKGCFLAVDELLPKYAPDVMEQLSKEALDTGRGADGKLYGIPCNDSTFSTTTFVIRGDFREKYNVSPVTDFNSLEVYLDAVKTNEKDIIPYNIASSGEGSGFLATTDLQAVPGSKFIYARENNLRDINILALTPEFESLVNIMNRWDSKGYFSKSILTNKILSINSFVDGKSAVASGNPYQIKQVIEKVLVKNPEWKPEAGSFHIKTKIGIHSVYGMNLDGMCVGKNSENPERALMVLNKLRSDRESYDILFYGINGRNHELTEDGMVKLPEGVTADKNGYPWDNEGQWGMRVAEFTRRSPDEWMDYYDVLLKTFKELETPDFLSNFSMNTELLANEVAALTQVDTQYVLPLRWGKTNNISKDLEILREKLKAAGAEKYLEEAQKQLNEYLDSINYNK